MFHISDCKKYTRCPRMFVFDRTAEKQPFQSFVRLDETVSDLAALKLGIKERFLGERGDAPEKALQAMEEYDWLIKARFEYDGLRIKVPFLHRTDEGWDIYFLFIGLYPQANDMQFYCNTVWVLENLGIQLHEYYLIHLNAEYVRGKYLDPAQLFCISDHFFNDRNHPSLTVETAIRRSRKDLSGMLREMENCTEETAGAPVRTSKCTGRQKCRYYERCFPEEEAVPYNSILTLSAAQYRYDMQKEGRLYLRDADPERIEGSRMQYAQIMADRNGGLFADRTGLRQWMADIQYPISCLDFEWERYAIPPYEGMRPFDVLPFEYSLHIMHENGEVDHRVFLSFHDDRRAFAERLLAELPETGTVMAYNANGAEMIRIRELAEQLPDLAGRLLAVNERMKDLQTPFESGLVYDTRMHGLWSLKVIMSMMDDPGYNDLAIRQGMDAVFQWRQVDRSDPDADAEEIIEELKEYCGMDTYAMTVVYKWLQEITEEVH